ncbi:MAG: hypothetical protein A3D52_02300 [Candidatus Taylorbacteria bacterium RIFCSPHIGHO2_02_FULL_44_36]|uniref:ComEC/Rec2-related protein domain-containing protein n=1 Tax=Candidatus Taylorbacteria bacterium RIFCSPLOWO2_12_FULL_44_15c TaxID=1802333 RepID=A0A1G2P5J2_9BACT|nr:MAG: hypothetical protein A3D52_02300 [Candidatus Taylorbacteria bacterium RIFCSPHIGHO2_02_FULL_44_36]OHA38205.1 MAG: hypothetical protein A3I97_02110 [Candidatus Taylorbacteria bacterium RIFCSPLOWO2_02_FULL_44_35]OHA43625.1 MAG: hypothetical protein A3G03_03190 [Candidatus Taylorbacteria bacterium RIFCSPLOWO2_12_FULL_44_15c]
MTRDKFFYFGLFGFALGIFFRSFYDFGASFWQFLIFLAGAILVAGLISHKAFHKAKPFSEKKVSPLFLISVIFFAASLGVWRFDFSVDKGIVPKLEEKVDQTVLLEGIISVEPDERENNTKLTIDIEEDRSASSAGKILVTVAPYPKFSYGDKVKLRGILEKPKNFNEPDDLRQFDYISYLAKDGIGYVMFQPAIILVSKNNGNSVKRVLFNFKNSFLENVGAMIPEPAGALSGGLVVGAKRSLGTEWLEKFRVVGVIHIVVLSGYNITIVAEFIMRLLAFLPRFARFSFGGLAIIFFAIMTGGSATVVRASLMAILVIVARATGRLYDITRALLLAGFLMILHNPKILVFDTSFQLSFLSTLGLIYLSPTIEKRLGFITEKLQLRQIAAATIATQIFVLPLLLYQMGQLSLVALPANLLILPTIPWTMLFGFLAGAIGFVSQIIALPFAFIAYILLTFQLKIVAFFATLSFASISIPYFPAWALFFCYAVFAFLKILSKRKTTFVSRQQCG